MHIFVILFNEVCTLTYIIGNMKQSDYNIFIEENTKVLCFNSFSNSFILISKEAYSDFQNNDLDLFAKQRPNTFQALCKSGFIIDDSIDQLAILRTENKREAFSPSIDYLMIYPTQDCNLKCWYCYETHVAQSKMSEKVVDATLNYITNLCKDSKNKVLRLTFFGGEPFLYYKDVVYPILVHAQATCHKYGKSFVPFFVTNASLINEKIIDELTPFNPVFQITIDGGECRHNKVRIWKTTDKGTYGHIIKTINSICKKVSIGDGNKSNIITVRINYDDETLDDIYNIAQALKDVDRCKVFIQLERVWQTMGRINKEQQNKLKQTLLYLTSEGFNVGYGLFGHKRIACPAEIDHYAIINWDGNVYKCNGRTLSVTNREGVLLQDGTIKWNEIQQVKRVAMATFENEMCLKCKMLPQCIGPCSQKIIENKNKDMASICSMRFADMNLEEYIRTNFEIELMKKQFSRK